MGSMDKLNNPIIFIGTGRSGTTIISEIVFRHKDLAFPSNYQIKFVKYPAINIFRNLFDNKLWRIHGQIRQLNKTKFINKIAFKSVEAYNMWEYITGEEINFSKDFLLNKRPNENQKKFIRTYFNKMVKYQNRKRLAFKITGPSRLEYLLNIFPDAQIVNITRSEIATISSFLKVDFWKSRGYNKLWWIGAYNDEEIKWVKENENDPISVTAYQIKKIKEITKIEVEKLAPSYLEVKIKILLKTL
jgi:Sulfotransferase family